MLTHGQVWSPKRCHLCQCSDGHVECANQEPLCPQLDCPHSQRIVEEGKCCPVCRGGTWLAGWLYYCITDLLVVQSWTTAPVLTTAIPGQNARMEFLTIPATVMRASR